MNGSPSENRLPLEDIRVLEFGHTVMGPSCAMVLADLGAEVIKIEPPSGDRTRRLKGFGSGYFGFFNRNKKSLAVDLKSYRGKEIVKRALATADVVVENFSPGMMARYGLSYQDVSGINDRVVYCSLKGFLAGPYQHRLALDEVVQMMGGLAYMTGPSGRPLRAGASVIDIMGGSYGAFAIVLALQEREKTGRGQMVECGLFETTAFLMGQHLAYAAQSATPVPPMPERVSAWSIYELFDTADGKKIFIGITSDQQWQRFCKVFKATDLQQDEGLRTNNDRIDARAQLIPQLNKIFGSMRREDIETFAETAKIAYARVARPEDLFDDPHLNANGTLMPSTLPGGIQTKVPKIPIRMKGAGFPLRSDPPGVGAHTYPILAALRYTSEEIAVLERDSIVVCANKKVAA
jgi:crotonobetainyl-CoA:carnitine CoA-transferase CaiB-like acyl-CoA transferase